jgi:2-keto-4-pentenoate hydratase/2-oxohepta-3-ene-1,7-dioic acid hydratase in catechol pathway
MKLLRYGELGAEKPGILDPQGIIRDLSGVVQDIAGQALGAEGLKRIKDLDLGSLPAVKGRPRLGPPIAMVPKFLGIGLNYRDHAEETGMPIPEAPIVFAKATSCISGPNDPILTPKAGSAWISRWSSPSPSAAWRRTFLKPTRYLTWRVT